MEIFCIAAVAANGVIGQGKQIPWQIPGEQSRFKEYTWGHAILMGRTTWESLGQALPGRFNIVLSRAADFQAPQAEVVQSLAQGLEAARRQQASKLFVIGGEQVYRLALDCADGLILTRIPQAFAGDAFFPAFTCPPFVVSQCETVAGPSPYTIETYRRIAPREPL
jgi:dihydrofolate reductase